MLQQQNSYPKIISLSLVWIFWWLYTADTLEPGWESVWRESWCELAVIDCWSEEPLQTYNTIHIVLAQADLGWCCLSSSLRLSVSVKLSRPDISKYASSVRDLLKKFPSDEFFIPWLKCVGLCQLIPGLEKWGRRGKSLCVGHWNNKRRTAVQLLYTARHFTNISTEWSLLVENKISNLEMFPRLLNANCIVFLAM